MFIRQDIRTIPHIIWTEFYRIFNSTVFSEQNADEAEWEAFQKEIAVEVAASADLTATDQMEETVGRQLEEIDDQMRAWTRVRNIEIRKDDVETRLRDKKSGAAADTSHVKTEMSDEEVSVSDIRRDSEQSFHSASISRSMRRT